MTINPSDEELLTASPERSGEVWSVIFRRHRPGVLRQAMLVCSNWQDAEDVLSLTFLEAWTHRHELRFIGGSSFPWLARTAINVSLNLRRTKIRYGKVLASLPQVTTAESTVRAEYFKDDPLFQKQSWLHEAIHGLKADDQALLVLTALYGYSLRDAAQLLSITEAAAKVRLHRLRRSVRRHNPDGHTTPRPAYATNGVSSHDS